VTLAILGLLTGLLAVLGPAIARWLKARADRAADPETARQNRLTAADHDIATAPVTPGIAPQVSAAGIGDLDELERLERMRPPAEGGDRAQR
jgi:hypothetical protein